jgi:predicted flap endonuclease-1-like 5' DNA nuclease
MFELNPLSLPDAALQHLIMGVVTLILGFIIGYSSRQRLIRSLESTLNSTQQDVDDCLRKPVRVTGTDEESVLNRIRSRANEIAFTRIGYATAAEADDLKAIAGIGPFLEKKLHAVDIYTFRQIANFTREDVDQVNDIIEFFPGRIERDRWVDQARELAKKK